MLTLDLLKANLTTGNTLDLANATTNKQVTQFLTELAAFKPGLEREEGEAFSLLANSGDGNFLISSEGTSFEKDGEVIDEIDLMDLFNLADIDLSEIDFGDLELDEETIDLIRFLLEDEEFVDLLLEAEVVVDDEAADGEAAIDPVKAAIEEYKGRIAAELEEMDERMALNNLAVEAQNEMTRRSTKLKALMEMETESFMTLVDAMRTILSLMNAKSKNQFEQLKQTFSR